MSSIADDAGIVAALDTLDVPLAPAEAHGLACGLLCSQSASAAKSRWFSELLEAAGLTAESLGARAGAVRFIDDWFEHTQLALNSADFEFDPWLPDDDHPLVQRLDALGDFCAGFTYGLGLGATHRGNAPLPEDTREIVRDFQGIDGADRGEDVTEADYAELVEYVRVGVIVVLEELRPVERTGAPSGDGLASPKLH